MYHKRIYKMFHLESEWNKSIPCIYVSCLVGTQGVEIMVQSQSAITYCSRFNMYWVHSVASGGDSHRSLSDGSRNAPCTHAERVRGRYHFVFARASWRRYFSYSRDSACEYCAISQCGIFWISFIVLLNLVTLKTVVKVLWKYSGTSSRHLRLTTYRARRRHVVHQRLTGITIPRRGRLI